MEQLIKAVMWIAAIVLLCSSVIVENERIGKILLESSILIIAIYAFWF